MNCSSRLDKGLFRFVIVLLLGAFSIAIVFDRSARRDLAEIWQCRIPIVLSQGNTNPGNEQ